MTGERELIDTGSDKICGPRLEARKLEVCPQKDRETH
jgi:hypothetical protein